MTYREVVVRLEREGWFVARQRGSHRVYKHSDKVGIVVIAPHRVGDDVPKGTLASISKQAGWT